MNRKLAGALALGLLGSASVLQAQDSGWIAAWTSPPIAYEPGIAEALGRPFENETVRQTLWSNASGSALRVRLSNELADEAVTIGAATIARVDQQGRIVPGTTWPLLFGNERSVVIPGGAPYYSDPVGLPVAQGESLVVDIHYPSASEPPAHAQQVLVATGDQTGRANLEDARRARAPGIVSGIEVAGESGARVLLAFGDSITEGAAASTPRMSWPQQLQALLAAAPAGRCWVVANAGISGNRLLHEGRGPAGLSRFDRDALSQPGVRTIVLLEGINDIGTGDREGFGHEAITADQVIDAYRQLIARAHAKGVRVIGGTLLPYEGAVYQSAEGEAKRQQVNEWIRSSGAFDAIIDFEQALQDPDHPAQIEPSLQSGDQLHPSDAGYTRMAQTAAPVILQDPCQLH